MDEVTISAKALSIRYADLVALDIQSLEVKGGVIALLGHNGAGKSTLIKTLLGLLSPHRGEISVRGNGGASLRPEHDMAFCPENGAVFADISVERYLQLWCRIKHNDGDFYRKAGSRYVERLSIAELLSKKGRALSKGQRRRVQTALGFMSDPKLFLFDEPFDGLDVQRTNDLMEIVEEERAHRSFLISSHRMDVMERLSDACLVLEGGRLLFAGDVAASRIKLAGLGVDNLTDAMRIHLHQLRESTQTRL
jgi:ABC-type multidrug transport system ATPase subunit